jgi:hypothetical protein
MALTNRDTAGVTATKADVTHKSTVLPAAGFQTSK